MPAPQSTCPSPVDLHMMLDDIVRHLCLVYVATEHGGLTFFECCAAFAAFCSCAVCSWAMACAVACNTATCCTAMLTLRATAASHSTSPALADLSSACMCALNDRQEARYLASLQYVLCMQPCVMLSAAEHFSHLQQAANTTRSACVLPTLVEQHQLSTCCFVTGV